MQTPSSLSYQLGSFVNEFRGDDLPDDVLQLAKFCLIDAVGCTIHGRAMPWTKLLLQQIDAIGRAGDCRLFQEDPGLNAQHAALLWGSGCHAFELDNLRRPGAGVHPGACIAMPALALAIENQNTGRQLLEAIALGIEGMFRIGLAAKHSSEKLGFHAPGITGPFGAALAASRLLGLSTEQTSFAMGLCGSLAGGLLEFSQANQGGMVKRLHMGRAAESGLLAARLAQGGYEGPHSILEGTFGILNVFCKSRDPSQILDGLGIRWESRTMCFKKYPSHITTQAILEFLARHGFPNRSKADQIRELVLHVPHKVISHHAAVEPSDLMGVQYSVPFMAACGCFIDVANPANISQALLHDLSIQGLVNKIRLVEMAENSAESWDARVEIKFNNGLEAVSGEQVGFPGSPTQPLGLEELKRKFLTVGLIGQPDQANLMRLFEALATVDQLDRITL